MKKVLLIHNHIHHYRMPAYNIIGEHFDLTVAYNLEDQSSGICNFHKIKFNTKEIGTFHFWGRNLIKECSKYDAVISSFDVHNVEFGIIPFIKRNFKVLTWSIGFRCGYNHPYDVTRKHNFEDNIALKIMNASDANIFYMKKSLEFWANSSLDVSKIFIAPNTTNVLKIEPSNSKTSILFVGSLYAAKGVDKLITAFSKAVGDTGYTLEIVGKGDQLDTLKKQVKDLNLDSKIIFHGAVYDESKLSELFSNALLCISPTQAGLTVPKSMGYGVPFVTKKDAITGGEIFHILNGVNGIIYNDDVELYRIIKDAINNPSPLIIMGQKAKEYYYNNATPEHQARGVINALNFVLNED